MSTSPVDPAAVRDELRKVAEAALAARLDHIDAITAAQQARLTAAANVAAARAADADAEAAERAAFRAAVTDGGWTTAELRKAGLTVPDSVARPGAKRLGRASATRRRTPHRPEPTADTTAAAAHSEQTAGDETSAA